MQVQENLSKTVIVVNISQITACAKGLQRAFFPEKQQHPWTTTGDALKHRSSTFRFIGEDWGRASARFTGAADHVPLPSSVIHMLTEELVRQRQHSEPRRKAEDVETAQIVRTSRGTEELIQPVPDKVRGLRKKPGTESSNVIKHIHKNHRDEALLVALECFPITLTHCSASDINSHQQDLQTICKWISIGTKESLPMGAFKRIK